MTTLEIQLYGIVTAAGCGVALGLLYDMLRPLRRRSGALRLFILDFFFSSVAAGTLFLLTVSVFQHRMRGFLPVSMALGWGVWEWAVFQTGRLLHGRKKRLHAGKRPHTQKNRKKQK